MVFDVLDLEENMTGEIAKYEGVSGSIQIRNMEDLSRVSKMLSASGFFSDARDAAQCGVKVLAGTEMGFGAFASMMGIHIIKGKPGVGANLMAAAVKRHPNYNYRVLEHSEQICRIEFYERWDGKMTSVGTSEFTLADARKAGTQNLDKHPRNMLFARAMSNGVKWYCPDVFDAPVYTPEELGAAVDGEGNYIETMAGVEVPVEVVPPPVKAAPKTVKNEVNPFIEQAKGIIAYAGENGVSVDAVKAACRENNLPDASAGYVNAAQVTTLSALVEDLVAESYGIDADDLEGSEVENG